MAGLSDGTELKAFAVDPFGKILHMEPGHAMTAPPKLAPQRGEGVDMTAHGRAHNSEVHAQLFSSPRPSPRRAPATFAAISATISAARSTPPAPAIASPKRDAAVR